MQTIEYRTIDKSDWPRGQWDYEPDKKQWQDAETGLPCLAVRGPGGHWCGYVGVPEGHPYYKKDYDEVPANAHGGLTFSAMCAEGAEEHGVCHKPDPGEPDHVWWLGFDCAHLDDLCPKWTREFSGFTGTYRSLSYVEAECAALARQLL